MPIKKSVGFRKIFLEPGEKKRVRFDLSTEPLAFYDITKQDFVVEPGAFDALVGSPSEDIWAKARFTVTDDELEQ